MKRVPEERVGVGLLHDPPGVRDRRAVRDVAHRRQVVRDQQEAQLLPRLQIFRQVHDVGADRHVERRDRLVQDDQLR
jgi:hypothetical protein